MLLYTQCSSLKDCHPRIAGERRILYNIISVILLLLTLLSPVSVRAEYEWMSQTFEALSSFFAECIEVPSFSYSGTGSKTLTFDGSGNSTGWQSTGINVRDGKTIKFEWTSANISTPVRKYYVMYRIDPRFNRPQTFILTGTTVGGITTYTSDIHLIDNGLLRPDNTNFQKYNNYFTFNNALRSTITINPSSVMNINLISAEQFFNAGAQGLTHELNTIQSLDLSSNPFSIYTQTGITDNNIVYMNSQDWCTALFGDNVPSGYTCSMSIDRSGELRGGWGMTISRSVLYSNDTQFTNRLFGIADTILWGGKLNICNNNASGKQRCLYDKGRGMKITVGGNVIKTNTTSFMHSDLTNQDFFYYDANASGQSGTLDFVTDWDMHSVNHPMFQSFNPLMTSWNYSTVPLWQNAFMGTDFAKTNALSRYLHFGRYIMYIEIGDLDTTATVPRVEYLVCNTSSPSCPGVMSGTNITRKFSGVADATGTLYLRAVAPGSSPVQGNIVVNYYNYTGSTTISHLVGDLIVSPLMTMIMDSTTTLYRNLSQNPRLRNYAHLLVTLYIVFYALYFLAGAVNVKASDVVMRIVKISIITILFSTNSWQFFNDNFFRGFIGGSQYLINSIVGATSGSSIFGFLDLVFEKYMNGKMWGLLCIELLSPFNGVTFFAIITIYSIFLYLTAVIQVVIGYLMAFISMGVLISLAPIFITLMLFERTKSIFNNWISAIFNCMLQPTILLLFFLLIDQIVMDQLPHVIVKACWDVLIPFSFNVDLKSFGVDISFSFEIPFLPGIPFFMSTPNDNLGGSGSYINFISSVMIFYCYAVLANGLTTYVSMLVGTLTSIGQSGDISGGAAAAQMSQGITNTISAPARGAADKIMENSAKKSSHKDIKEKEMKQRGGGAKVMK